MQRAEVYARRDFTLGWGILFILIAAAMLVVVGMPFGPITIFGGLILILFAYRYPYVAFGALVLLIPFLGVLVHIPAGDFSLSERVFGGSIDILASEVLALAVLIAWALKMIVLWMKRNDSNWKPWLPLVWPMTAILATHLLSAFSVFQPDTLLILKYTIRPVLWTYLIYVALTVNFIRSPRRLRAILSIVVITGMFAAIMGFFSLFFALEPGQIVPRAKPLPLFGAHPIGENHNLLAEWLSVAIMCSLALVFLVKEKNMKRLLVAAAIFQAIIALLTFARSLWIVLSLEAVLLAVFVWREKLKAYAHYLVAGLLLLMPVIGIMIAFSASTYVAGSTSTRLMLTEITLNVWSQSPFIGAGAGTYVDRIGSTALFVIEYGTPLDAHGWAQKLLAEVGTLGVLAVLWLLFETYRSISRIILSMQIHSKERMILTILLICAGGAVVYQLFNTNYWTGKLWFPIGLALAASRALKSTEAASSPLDEHE